MNPESYSYFLFIKSLICCQIYTKQKYLHYIIILITKNPKFIYIMQYIWWRRTKQKMMMMMMMKLKSNWIEMDSFTDTKQIQIHWENKEYIIFIRIKAEKELRKCKRKWLLWWWWWKLELLMNFIFFLISGLLFEFIFPSPINQYLYSIWNTYWLIIYDDDDDDDKWRGRFVSQYPKCVYVVCEIFFPYPFCFNIYTEQRIYVLIE